FIPGSTYPLKSKSSVLLSFAPTVTSTSCGPYFSCQASMVYLPGGSPLMVNVPSSPVTAKNGLPTTPIYERIHGCTLHFTGIMTSSRGNRFTSESPLGGCDWFHS